MNIKDMPPKQLNALVHTQVMGKRIDEACESPYNRHETFKRCDACGHVWTEQELDLNGYGPQTLFDLHTIPVPNYVQDIGAAWEITRCPRFHQVVLTSFIQIETEVLRYSCTVICLHDGEEKWYVSYEKTAPYAICYAALQAVGVIDMAGTVKGNE